MYGILCEDTFYTNLESCTLEFGVKKFGVDTKMVPNLVLHIGVGLRVLF